MPHTDYAVGRFPFRVGLPMRCVWLCGTGMTHLGLDMTGNPRHLRVAMAGASKRPRLAAPLPHPLHSKRGCIEAIYKPGDDQQIAHHPSTPSSTSTPNHSQHVEADYHRCHRDRCIQSLSASPGASLAIHLTQKPCFFSWICCISCCPGRPVRFLYHSSPSARNPFVGKPTLERQRKVQDDHHRGFYPIPRGGHLPDRRPRRLRLGARKVCQRPLRGRILEDPR